MSKDYGNKIDLNPQTSVARINKVEAQDFNDIAGDIGELEQAVGGAGYWFAKDDSISVADNVNLDVGTGDFSLIVKRYVPENVTGTEYILNKEDSGVGYGLYRTEDDLYIRLDDGTTDASAIIGTAVFSVGVACNISVSFDRSGDATAYINGLSVGTVDVSSASATLDNAGAFVIGSTTAGTSFLNGTLDKIGVFNTKLTVDEINTSISYKYIGASQTAKITDFTASHDYGVSSSGGWEKTGTPTSITTNTDGKLTVDVTGDTQGLQTIAQIIYKLNKLYMAKFTITSTNWSNGNVDVVVATNTNQTIIDNGGAISEAGGVEVRADGTYRVIFEYGTTNSDTSAGVGIYSDDYSGNYTFTIEDFTITQIGCVADYSPDGVETNQWKDVSGNGINGDVDGATVINAWNKTESVEYAVSSSKTFTLPKDFIITNIMYENASGSIGDLEIGFGAGTNEIVNQTSIATGTVSSIHATVGKKTNADDTIYITTTQEMTVKVLMERV